MTPHYLTRFQKLTGDNDAIAFLIKTGVASQKAIRNYMILFDFYKRLQKQHRHYYSIYSDLGAVYDLDPRQIANIIAKWRKKLNVQ